MAKRDKEIDAFLDDDSGNVAFTSDKAIDDFLDDKADKLEVSAPGAMQKALEKLKLAAKQGGQAALAAVNPVQTLKQSPDLANRVMNFQQGAPNAPATGLMEAAMNRPDVTGTIGASVIPGVGLAPSAARIAGTAASAALNPKDRGTNAAVAGGVQALFEAIPYGIGKVAPAARSFFSKISQTDADGLKKMFDNPSFLFTGPSKEQAQAVYKAAAEKAGLTPEVSDEVLFGARKKFLKNITQAMKAGEEVPTQSLLDARTVAHDLTAKAARQGEKNLARGFHQKVELIQKQLSKQAPELREADKVYSAMKTRTQFLNLLPRNRAGEFSLNFPSLAAGLLSGGKALVGASPAVQGAAASALGAVAYAPRALGFNAADATRVSLQTIRQYLTGQQQNGPGSR